MAMPRNSVRVVCTLGVTIATLLPTSALISVDLPALGAPISATKPQRLPSSAGASDIDAVRAHTFAIEQRGRRGLLCRTLGTAGALGRLAVGQCHVDAKHRAVMRPGPRHFAICGGG